MSTHTSKTLRWSFDWTDVSRSPSNMGKKIEKTERIKMPHGNDLKHLDEADPYKYLGILQADNIKHTEAKKKVSSDYILRAEKILTFKLNGGNTIKTINTWPIPVIRCPAGIVDCTQAEPNVPDRKTRKIMTMTHALQPHNHVDRLYLPRKMGAIIWVFGWNGLRSGQFPEGLASKTRETSDLFRPCGPAPEQKRIQMGEAQFP
ncbi:uncharacterized protein LOC117670166 [Pantherophis guttatus]|uniref:Uncharacterized protein LOC117670166 n=1 Tax=Pantherophis guttatus TaxID=94885 RepID=A0A6P9C9Z9_PANGU|nr:uncharacterized protein LOC117670166 [Pantherophis guttatus]